MRFRLPPLTGEPAPYPSPETGEGNLITRLMKHDHGCESGLLDFKSRLIQSVKARWIRKQNLVDDLGIENVAFFEAS